MENIVLEPDIGEKSNKINALNLPSTKTTCPTKRGRLRLRKNYGALHDPANIELDKAVQFQLLCRQYHIVNSEFACLLFERNELRERVEELEEQIRRLMLHRK